MALKTSDAAKIAACNELTTHSYYSKDRLAREVARQAGCSVAEAKRAVEAVQEWISICELEDLRDLANTLPLGTCLLLDTRNGKARSRTLPEGVKLVNNLAVRSITEITPGIEAWCEDGGGVANSYDYSAETDRLNAMRVDGRLFVRVYRSAARKAAYGKTSQPADRVMSRSSLLEIIRSGVSVRLDPKVRPVVPAIGVAVDANQSLSA